MEPSHIDFNPDDYTYLDKDKLPLAGWMWEFIRRSDEYRGKYEDIERISKTEHLLTRSMRRLFEYEETYSRSKDHLHFRLTNLKKDNFIRPLIIDKDDKDSKHFLLLSIDKFPHTFVGIPKPTSKYNDFRDDRSFVPGAKAVLSFKLSDGDIEKLSREVFSYYLKSITHSNPENTLYVGISLGANPEDVQKEFNVILDNIKSKKKKAKSR